MKEKTLKNQKAHSRIWREPFHGGSGMRLDGWVWSEWVGRRINVDNEEASFRKIFEK